MTLIPFRVLGIELRWMWRTGILKTYNGLENRAAFLLYPRESWALTVAVDAELDRRELRLALFGGAVDPWDLPLEYESVLTQNDVTGLTAVVDATYVDWISTGAAVLVQGPDPDDFYTTTISGSLGSLGSLSLSLADAPPSGTYPAGLTRVMPLRQVYLTDGQATGRQWPEGSTTDAALADQGAGTWRINATAAEYSTTFGTGGGTLTTFDGYNVLDWTRMVVEEMAEESFQTGLRRFDYGGIITQEWSRTQADILRSHQLDIGSDADRQRLKKFLVAIVGRQKAFLLPTWQPDLDLEAQPAGGTTIEVTQNPGFLAWFNASAAYRYLQLLKEDDSVEYVKVSGVVDNMDGTETITVTSTIGAGDVVRVSMLELVRLGGEGAAGSEDDQIAWRIEGDSIDVDFRVSVVQR